MRKKKYKRPNFTQVHFAPQELLVTSGLEGRSDYGDGGEGYLFGY